PITGLNYTFQSPPKFKKDSPAIPPDFSSFLAYDEKDGRLTLTAYITITEAQAKTLTRALDQSLAPGIEDLLKQSQKPRRPWIEQGLALDLLGDPLDEDVIARVLRRTAPLLEGPLLAARITEFSGLDQRMCDALLDTVLVAKSSRT